jgi:hypothetical protein
VADLRDALQVCLDRGVILANDEPARRELALALKPEREGQTYRDATGKVVSIFQGERSLQPSGEVDERTAAALNALLRELGLLDEGTPGGEPQSFVVSGQVRGDDGRLLRELQVAALHVAEPGDIRLGADQTDGEGRYTIRYAPPPGTDQVHLRVAVADADGQPLQSSEVIRGARPLEIVNLAVPATIRPAGQRWIEGRVVFADGLPAEGLRLRLQRLDFGGAQTPLGETTTRDFGLYALSYPTEGRSVSLQIGALDPQGQEVPLSKPLHDLGDAERTVVNLVAPSSLQRAMPEYRRLANALAPQIGDMQKLADARENDERQDLTLLNRATGCDARLAALAATAARLSADPQVGLAQEALYGLFRAGLPSEKLQLALVDVATVEQVLKEIRDAGIVGLTDAEIAAARGQFETFTRQARLALPVPGSRATYDGLLKASGLSDDDQAKFASVYLADGDGGTELWKKARQAGLQPPEIRTLQLQGKLAFLAGNSEAMIVRLMQKQLADPAQLVEQDFHRTDAWAEEVFDLAGIPEERRNNLTDADKQKLDEVIPAVYADEKVEDRLTAYAEEMARKLSLSYPAAAVARIVEQDQADTFRLGEARGAAATALKQAAAKGFRLGQTPVETFLRANPDVLDGVADAAAARQSLKTLHCVYQLTPSQEAMPVLTGLGLMSAYDVIAHSEPAFTERYIAKYLELYGKPPAPSEPQLVYRKAQQIDSVTHNLFAIAKTLESAPALSVTSPSAEVRETAKQELIKQVPTLESLFGSMDFCECEHCRSVLSPAA